MKKLSFLRQYQQYKALPALTTAMLAVVLAFGLVSCGGDGSLDPSHDSGGGGVTIKIARESVQYHEIDNDTDIEWPPSLDGRGEPGYYVGDGCSYYYIFLKSTEEIDHVRKAILSYQGLSLPDDTFFIENNLVMIELWDKMGSIIHELGTVSLENGELNIVIDRYLVEFGTTDIAYRIFLVPIKKTDFNGDTINIEVISHPWSSGS